MRKFLGYGMKLFYMINSKKLKIFLLIYLPVFYIIFFPTFIFKLSLQQGQLLLYVTFPILLIFYVFFGTKVVKIKNLFLVLIIVFLLNLLGIIFKLNIMENISMLITHFRYLIYAFILIVAYNIGLKLSINEKEFIILIKSIYISIIFFLIIQYFSNNMFTSTISNREIISYMGIQVGGPFIWSYALGFFFIFGYFYMFLKFVFKTYDFYILINFLVLCIILIFTQSKAVYISIFLLSLITLFFINFTYKVTITSKIRINIIVSILFLSLIMIIINNLDQLYNISRFIDYFETGDVDASTTTRLNQLSNIYASLQSNLFFGQPLYNIVIENAYGYYLYNFGIIGFICYITVLVIINYLNYKIFKYYNEINNKEMIIISYSMYMLTLSIFIFSLAASILDGHKMAYLFWFILGLYYSIIYNKKGKINELFRHK